VLRIQGHINPWDLTATVMCCLKEHPAHDFYRGKRVTREAPEHPNKT